MGEYISDVNLLKARRYLHSGITDCDITDDIPALEWAPHWLQRIDLKLRVCVGFYSHKVNYHSERTMLMPNGIMEREKTSTEIMTLRLMA